MAVKSAWLLKNKVYESRFCSINSPWENMLDYFWEFQLSHRQCQGSLFSHNLLEETQNCLDTVV